MAKKKRNPNAGYEDQAQALTLTRYGPEISALAALLRDAQENRDLAVRQAKTGRQYTVGAVDQAKPAVTQAYRGAGQTITPAFVNGGGIEAQALGARLGEAQAQAQVQLGERRIAAIEGEHAARTQAQRDFRSDQTKIGMRASDLARESGAYTSSTIAELIGQDAAAQAQIDKINAQNKQSERNAWIGAGVDPSTGKPIPGGSKDPRAKQKPNSGRGWASQEQHAAAADAISDVQSWAQKLKAQRVGRHDAAAALSTGAEPHPIYRTVKLPNGSTKQERVLNKDGTQAMTPKLPAAKSKLLLTAALDMAYDGHLSRKTQRLLHQRGMRIDQLGDLTTFQQWLKTPEGKAWKRSQRKVTRPTQAVPGLGAVG